MEEKIRFRSYAGFIPRSTLGLEDLYLFVKGNRYECAVPRGTIVKEKTLVYDYRDIITGMFPPVSRPDSSPPLTFSIKPFGEDVIIIFQLHVLNSSQPDKDLYFRLHFQTDKGPLLSFPFRVMSKALPSIPRGLDLEMYDQDDVRVSRPKKRQCITSLTKPSFKSTAAVSDLVDRIDALERQLEQSQKQMDAVLKLSLLQSLPGFQRMGQLLELVQMWVAMPQEDRMIKSIQLIMEYGDDAALVFSFLERFGSAGFEPCLEPSFSSSPPPIDIPLSPLPPVAAEPPSPEVVTSNLTELWGEPVFDSPEPFLTCV